MSVAEGQLQGWKWEWKNEEDCGWLSDEKAGDGLRTLRHRACSDELVVYAIRVLTSPADLTKAVGMGREGQAVRWHKREDDANESLSGEPVTPPSSNCRSRGPHHCCSLQRQVERREGTTVGIVTRKETPRLHCESWVHWRPRAEPASAASDLVLWR